MPECGNDDLASNLVPISHRLGDQIRLNKQELVIIQSAFYGHLARRK